MVRTTPTGDLYRIYRNVTKGQLFWCALALCQFQLGESVTNDELERFIKAEAKLWIKRTD